MLSTRTVSSLAMITGPLWYPRQGNGRWTCKRKSFSPIHPRASKSQNTPKIIYVDELPRIKWIPQIRTWQHKQMYKSDRNLQTRIFGLTASHCKLKAHQTGLTNSATWRYVAPKQTPQHILKGCPDLAGREEVWARWMTLQDMLWGSCENLKCTALFVAGRFWNYAKPRCHCSREDRIWNPLCLYT